MAQLMNRTRRGFTASLALLGTSAALMSTLPGCAATPAIDHDAVLASPLRPVDDRKADARRMPADLLRLSVGIEAASDLIKDIDQALAKATA